MRHFYLGGYLGILLCASAFGQDSLERQLQAIEKQRASIGASGASVRAQLVAVRKQIKLATPADERSFFVVPSPEPELQPDPGNGCDAIPPMASEALISRAAARHGVGADLIRAVIAQESGFRPCAVSRKGAQGLMQLMPATAEQLGVTDPFDPEQNVSAGATLLKQLLERYGGDLNRTLGAYNAGPAKVDAAEGIPPIPETIGYVSRILSSLEKAREF